MKEIEAESATEAKKAYEAGIADIKSILKNNIKAREFNIYYKNISVEAELIKLITADGCTIVGKSCGWWTGSRYFTIELPNKCI